jgi:uncharacterized membrane protein
LRVHPRLFAAFACSGVAAWALPERLHGAVRVLAAWNVGAWIYIVKMWLLMRKAEHSRARRHALSHADGALAVALLAVAASLVAIVAMLRGYTSSGAGLAWPHVTLYILMLIGGWP